MYANY